MPGGELQSGIIGGDRLVRTIELEQRIAAIAERIDVVGIERERALRSFPAPPRREQPQQRHAAAVERIGLAGRERERGVVAGQRVLEAAHGEQDEPQIRQRVRAAAISPPRSAEAASAASSLPR